MDMTGCDYVILNQHADNFADLLTNAITHQVPVIQANFVNRCVEEGRLLDHQEFIMDGYVIKRKRGRPTIASKELPQAIEKKTRVPAIPPSQAPPHLRYALTADQVMAAYPGLDEKLRERLPSPPQTVIAYVVGRNKYTKEDLDYGWKAIEIMLEMDPKMPLTVLSLVLAEKMPHHSTASWGSIMSRGKDQLELLRKKTAIASRKSQQNDQGQAPGKQATNGNYHTSQPREPSVSTNPSTAQASPAPPTPPPQENGQVAIDEEADDHITQFLGSGGADGKSDEEAWETLSALHPYKSPEEWKGHWDTHGERLNEIVVNILNTTKPEPE